MDGMSGFDSSALPFVDITILGSCVSHAFVVIGNTD